MQIPIGLEDDHSGVIDLIKMKALYFDGTQGETVREEEIYAWLVTTVGCPVWCVCKPGRVEGLDLALGHAQLGLAL